MQECVPFCKMPAYIFPTLQYHKTADFSSPNRLNVRLGDRKNSLAKRYTILKVAVFLRMLAR